MRTKIKIKYLILRLLVKNISNRPCSVLKVF